MGLFGKIFYGPIGGILEDIGVLPKDPVTRFAESFVDNVIRDTVQPVSGCVVYCELAGGRAEHSGIYVGANQIVHLDGGGSIELASPTEFLGRLGGFNSAMSIYVSCKDGQALGSKIVAKRAREMIGKRRNYNLLFDNCHQFTAGCLTGNFENSDNFFIFLRTTAEQELGTNEWRVWER